MDIRSPRVTVITEADVDEAGLEATGVSLLAQTFRDWEWTVVTGDSPLAMPVDDQRVRVVSGASRVQALRDALRGEGDVALLAAGQTLAPTALEKWLWFLEAHPTCAAVRSATPSLGASVPRLIRRRAVIAADGLDAAAEIAHRSEGFVPLPDKRPEPLWGSPAPGYSQPANEWLPEEPLIANPVEGSRRRMLLVVPSMTAGATDAFNLDLLDQLAEVGWTFTVVTTEGRHDLYREFERRTTDIFPLAHFLPLPYQPSFLRYLIEARRPDVVLLSNSVLGYRLLPYIRGLCPDTPLVDLCHSETEDWESGGCPRFSVECQELLDLTMTSGEHVRRWMIERGGRESRIAVCEAVVADLSRSSLETDELLLGSGPAVRLPSQTDIDLEGMGSRINELLDRAIELHRTDPGPVPTRALSKIWATQTLELTRLDRLTETMWASGRPLSGRREGARLLRGLLRSIGRPLYRFGVRRHWKWLPAVRHALERKFVGDLK